MKCLVTGAAGFIGSHLSERLLATGHSVVGIDAFIPYYHRSYKDSNLAGLRGQPGFSLFSMDLRQDDLQEVVEDVDAVFHLAAMPGLAKSWTNFDLYESCNITGTQRLLEALRLNPNLHRFIYVSTSSVYGRYGTGDETLPTRPISPYGVTKLAGENLCRAYCEERGLPLVVLRYFSVYGPRQRPDMGYHLFINAMLRGEPITIYGDGNQTRGNTYIQDCVSATEMALNAPIGETYNIGGGETASVLEILGKLQTITGTRPQLHFKEARPGDQRITGADTSKITRHLGWHPEVSLDQGLARQVAWQRQLQRLIAA